MNNLSMWFYWMNVFGKLQIVCLIICVFAGFLGCVAFGCYIDNCGEGSLKAAKRLALMALCFGLAGVFIPSEKTITKMLIASQLNEINAEQAKEVVDYIIDKVKEVREEQK